MGHLYLAFSTEEGREEHRQIGWTDRLGEKDPVANGRSSSRRTADVGGDDRRWPGGTSCAAATDNRVKFLPGIPPPGKGGTVSVWEMESRGWFGKPAPLDMY